MDVKLPKSFFFLGLFIIVTVKSDVNLSEKTCQPGSGSTTASGGSLNQMIGQLFPCNVDSDSDSEEEATIPTMPTRSQDIRFDKKRSDEIANSVMDLAQRLMEDITEKTSNKFEIVSPISIVSALHLALLGSHGITYNELMDLLEYNTKAFSQFPSQIHEEFGLILEDLENNLPDPSRFRPKVPWREKSSKEYQNRAMKFQSKQPNYNEHKIRVANGIFIQRDYSIRSEYSDVVTNVYKSQIQTLDFRREPQKSAKVINDWVNEKTNGKIKEIITGTSPETRVILVNALYFNAEWQETFFDGATGFKKFYPNGKDDDYSVNVELMAHGGKFPHYYDAESDCEILGLPYKQNATTMYVILPKNSNPEKLRKAQKILTAAKIEKMISQMVIKTAVILFPKMHLSCKHQLKSRLQDLGLTTLFDPSMSDLSVLSEGYQKTDKFTYGFLPEKSNEQFIFGRVNKDDEATNRTKREVTYKTNSEFKSSNPLSMKDFMIRKRIVKKGEFKKLVRNKRQYTPYSAERLEMLRHRSDLKNPQLYAEEVIHKVELTINEKGTEGGASTAITLNRSGTNVVFRVDTPFMFLIRHDPTHIALFYGVVFEPEN